jgi:Flp pilus assembly secretin CpaC
MRTILWGAIAAAGLVVPTAAPGPAFADELPPRLRPVPKAAAGQMRKAVETQEWKAEEVQVRKANGARVIEGRAEMVEVVLDLARILKLDEPAKTIVIGNPAVLDATVTDERTLVLTGKVLGMTNMIVLDGGGTEVANMMINVVQGRHIVTVHRGSQKETYNCAGACRPTVAVGTGEAGTQAAPATTGSVQQR